MRIVFDGREVESLDRKVARRLGQLADSPPVVEGVILFADPIIADTGRRTRIGLGVVVGVAAAILIGVGVFALGYEPKSMVVAGPLYLAILAALGWGGPLLYRRNMAQVRENTARRLARMAPPGTPVRLDGAGLTLGGRSTPWSDITLDVVEIVTEHNPDGEDGYSIQAVVLGAGGQAVVLDAGVMANGVAIIAKALRMLGYPGPQ